MIKESLQRKVEFNMQEGEEVQKAKNFSVMDQPELSLGPSFSLKGAKNCSLSSSDNNSSKKRKHTWDEPIPDQAGIELHLNDPLPLGWEQCLDLQSGRMYYLNRKTLKKSWTRPKEKNLNLDLNISTFSCSQGNGSSNPPEEYSEKHNSATDAMVAIVCVNCHLLVMLCKSSPLCPNCRYMNSSPLTMTMQRTSSMKIDAVKPLETLSLLH